MPCAAIQPQNFLDRQIALQTVDDFSRHPRSFAGRRAGCFAKFHLVKFLNLLAQEVVQGYVKRFGQPDQYAGTWRHFAALVFTEGLGADSMV